MLNRLRRPSTARLYRPTGAREVALSPDGTRVSVVTGSRLVVYDVGARGAPTCRTVVRVPGGISGHAWCREGSVVLTGAAELLLVRPGSPLVTVPLTPPGPAVPQAAPDAAVPLAAPDSAMSPAAPDAAVLVDADQHRAGGVLVRTGTGLHLVSPRGPNVVALDVPVDADRLLLDRWDRPRCAVRWERDGALVVLARDGGEWLPAARLQPPDSLLTFPVDLDADGTGLYLHGPFGGPHLRIAVLDLATGRHRVVAEEPGRDVDAVLLHPVSRRPTVIRTVGSRPCHRGLTQRAAEDVRRLGTAHPGDFRIVAQAADGEAWLARFDADRMAPRYVLWNRRERSAFVVPHAGRTVAASRLASCVAFEATASDGLALPGFLTMPRGARGPVPAVLLVHGGPWARDEWEFNPDVQWIAARGFACLQVNFRGSEGYGVAHMDAADHDWGGRMQTDLLDIVRWAAASGRIDPSRVAIMGSSYGGYAALAAATMGPPVFAAAVAIGAPSDLVAFTRPLTRERSYLNALFLRRLGHPDTDEGRLSARSPLRHAARCHTPVLLAHGALDELTPVCHAEWMAAALREHGKPHQLMIFADEGHGIRSPANRIALARRVGRFLGREFGRLRQAGRWR